MQPTALDLTKTAMHSRLVEFYDNYLQTFPTINDVSDHLAKPHLHVVNDVALAQLDVTPHISGPEEHLELKRNLC